MKQMTFADAEYAGKRKQTRKELFLIEMDRVVPWKGLIALIEPHYPKGEGGRPAYPLMAMLRVHLMQNWFGYSDPAMEEALYETTILRQFAGLEVSFGFCMSVVQNGYFDDTKPDRGSPQDQRNQQPPPSTSPAYQPSQQQAGTTVTRVPYEKGRFLW